MNRFDEMTKTVRIYFNDHAPVVVTANIMEVLLHIENAKMYPGYVSWDAMPDRRKQ